MPKTVLHIQHNTTLAAVHAALSLFQRSEGADPYQFAEYTGMADSVAVKLVLPTLRQMGVIQGKMLAPFGRRLCALRDNHPELIGEAVHLRLSILHLIHPSIRFSLSYATVCAWLCERGDFVLDDTSRSVLAGHVIEDAARFYAVDPGSIAFSKSSVNGAIIWLRSTNPPALASGNDQFRLRNAVSALSILWAVDALYRRDCVPFGTRLSLTEEREALLCRWLLIEPNSLFANLSLSARTEGARRTSTNSAWLTMGTEGGFGTWLLLAAPAAVGASHPGEDDSDLTAQVIPEDEVSTSEDAEMSLEY
jgi:hypothetical protein